MPEDHGIDAIELCDLICLILVRIRGPRASDAGVRNHKNKVGLLSGTKTLNLGTNRGRCGNKGVSCVVLRLFPCRNGRSSYAYNRDLHAVDRLYDGSLERLSPA